MFSLKRKINILLKKKIIIQLSESKVTNAIILSLTFYFDINSIGK